MRNRLKTIANDTYQFSLDTVANGMYIFAKVPQEVWTELSALNTAGQTTELERRVAGALKLVFDETAHVLLCATNFKSRITAVATTATTRLIKITLSYPEGATFVELGNVSGVKWLKYSVTKNEVTKEYTLSEDDLLTIEFDWGDTIKDHIPTDYAKPSHITAGVNEIKNFLGVAGSDGEGEYQALSMQDIFDMCDDIDTAILGENHPGLVTAEEHAAIIAAIDIDGDTDWDDYVEPSNE